MKLTEVAIVAVDGFSPFHYSVPCMLFGDTVSETKRFNLHICAERPGLLSARDGFALNASGDFSSRSRRISWWCPTGGGKSAPSAVAAGRHGSRAQ